MRWKRRGDHAGGVAASVEARGAADAEAGGEVEGAESAGEAVRGARAGGDEHGVKLEVDHIVPVSAGGTDEMSNLRVLCCECNRGKGGSRQRCAA